MQQQTNLANQNREKEALQTGGSALPTPIGQSTDVGDLNGKKPDQLSELRAEVDRMRQEQKQAQMQQMQQAGAAGQPGQAGQVREQFDDSLATAIQQLSQLTDSWTPHGIHLAGGQHVTCTWRNLQAGRAGSTACRPQNQPQAETSLPGAD